MNLRNIIDLGFDYPFQIKFNEGKLLVSAEVRDQEGQTVAKIKDNQWDVNSNSIVARDRNYDDYVFEVIDSNNVPVLQVSVQNTNQVYVGGLFYVSNGRLLISPQGIEFNPTDIDIAEQLKPMFTYPSRGGSLYAIPIIILGAVLGGLALFLVPWGFEVRKTRDYRRAKKKIIKKKARVALEDNN